jgi:hypothetical protein
MKYVGVIWFVFHGLQLLPINFPHQNSCCINKSIMKHLLNRIENYTSFDLVVFIGSACLLIFLTKCIYRSSQLCVHYTR